MQKRAGSIPLARPPCLYSRIRRLGSGLAFFKKNKKKKKKRIKKIGLAATIDDVYDSSAVKVSTVN